MNASALSNSVLSSIQNLTSLVPALSQNVTNGASLLGTLDAPSLPEYLSVPNLGSTAFNSKPWGRRTAANTNPYEQCPPDIKTSTREYDLHFSTGTLAPVGIPKEMLLINGSYPGPTIEANWCDTLKITVHNDLSENEDNEGLSIHWHGFLQKYSQWADGVPTVQQCPIRPGQSMTYEFQAQLYGTSWYHSHYSAQYADGTVGPIVIYGPSDPTNERLTTNGTRYTNQTLGNTTLYDIDVGPIMLSDWYQDTYQDLLPGIFFGTESPPIQNNVINGKMNSNCSQGSSSSCTSNAGLSKFSFQSGKKHRLRLINAGADATQTFTIDGHKMTIIANDFVPVVPYETNVVTLGVGQRTDVIVEGTMAPDSAVWMRSDTCVIGQSRIHALAAIYYEAADNTSVPSNHPTNYVRPFCGNDDLKQTVPLYKFPAVRDPDVTVTFTIDRVENATTPKKTYVWQVNGVSFRGDYNNPILPMAIQGNYSFEEQRNVLNLGTNGSVRVVIINKSLFSHPIHLHGHNFFVLYDSFIPYANPAQLPKDLNVQRRDTQLMGPGYYLVVQYDTDNPGTWPLHCHIAWHLSGGLYVNMMEQVDDLRKVQLPSVVNETCTGWDAWTANHVVHQIDSGLRMRERE